MTTAICEYRAVGMSNFLFAGWPDFETLESFTGEIMPIARPRQDAADLSTPTAPRDLR